MRCRNFFECARTENFFHFGLKGFGKKSVNIVIAIIYKNKSAVPDVFFKILSLVSRELNEFVTAQIAEWAAENVFASKRNDVFCCVDR